MPPRALIFGAGGQDGWYLQKLLERENVHVTATSRRDPSVPCDVGSFVCVEDLVRRHQPDYIFHLAASSSTRHEVIFENQRSIVDGTLNVLEAAKRHTPHARIFLSGSALQFKNSSEPIDERTPFEASSAYSAQRIASVYASRYYRSQFGLRVYIGYFFHHDSPRREPHHVAQKVAQTARMISSGSTERLELERMDFWKEWTFAGDSMAAIWLLINQESHFEAVIGSGEVHSIREWVVECFHLVGLEWTQHVVEKMKNPSHRTKIVSNPALLYSLGWKPKVAFADLARMMVESACNS